MEQSYVEDRYDKSKKPAGDPDCRLSCKRRHNRQPRQPVGQDPPATPTRNNVPAAGLAVGEYYAIVLAEAKDLAHKGRFDRTLEDVVAVIETDPLCLVYPIDLDVVKQPPASLDIHDSLVVGVALAQLAPVDGVITRDQEITSSGSVPVIW